MFNTATDGMGIGSTGLGDPNLQLMRKFRWTMEVRGNSAACPFYIPPYFCKVSGRPHYSFEEYQLNFLNDRKFIPGKYNPETLTVTYMSVAGAMAGDAGQAQTGLYTWLNNMMDFRSPGTAGTAVRRAMSSRQSAYTATATIIMYDGCGAPLERWDLTDAWPQTINWGDLSMESNDTADIEITLRYSNFYITPGCNNQIAGCGCIGC